MDSQFPGFLRYQVAANENQVFCSQTAGDALNHFCNFLFCFNLTGDNIDSAHILKDPVDAFNGLDNIFKTYYDYVMAQVAGAVQAVDEIVSGYFNFNNG